MNPNHWLRIGVLFLFILAGSWTTADVRAQQLLTNDTEKIDFARGLLDQGQYTLAVSQFDEFIEQFSTSTFLADAYLGGGEARFFLKDYDKAIEYFQKYLTQFPDAKSKGTAQVRLGQIYYIKGDFESSLKYFNETAMDGLSPQFKQTLHFFKGQILSTQNNREEALANLQAAAEIPEAQAYAAQAYLKWGSLIVDADPKGALEKYVKAFEKADTDELKAFIMLRQGEANYLLKEYDQAAAIFMKTMNDNLGKPIMIDAMTNWYTVLISQKRYDALTAHFNQQLKAAIDKPEYFSVYILAAKAMAGAGNTDGASVMLDQVSALNGITPKQKSDVIVQKTRILFEAGKFADVPVFVDAKMGEIVEVKPALLILKAKAYLSLKDYDNAWLTFEAISKEFPEDPAIPQTVCGMGYVRYGQEKFDEAGGIFMDCFNKTQDAQGRKDAAYNAFTAYKKANNDDKTMEAALQYLALEPPGEQKPQVALSLSGIYTRRQQFDKAQETLQPYLKDPDETIRRNAAFQSAYNLQSSGKTGEALAAYQEFVTDGKNDRLTYLALKNSCMIYLQIKNEDKAAEFMHKAIMEFPESDFTLKTYLWLTEHWQAKNDAAKMLEVLAVAEKKFGQDPDAVAINFFKGQAYRIQENCKLAFENYDVVIKSPNAAVYKGRARLGKGVCFQGLGDYPSAEKELEQAVVDSPDDVFVAMRARFSLARNAELIKDYEMAVKLYLVVDVLYNDPEYAPKSLLRAAVLMDEKLKNQKEAANAYNKIIQVYPNSPEAQKAREQLGLSK